jgi:hypothetical protein
MSANDWPGIHEHFGLDALARQQHHGRFTENRAQRE